MSNQPSTSATRAVGRGQVAEPQRAHDAGHRHAGGLVGVGLHAQAVGMTGIRRVLSRRGQPQHAAVSQNRQGSVQVGLQVVGILQPDRQAEERVSGPLPVAAQVFVV